MAGAGRYRQWRKAAILALALAGFGLNAAAAKAAPQVAAPRVAAARLIAPRVVAPVLKLAPQSQNIAAPQMAAPQAITPRVARPRVALTFDLCMGQADRRILAVLEENAVPATLFITRRFAQNSGNQAVLAEIRARPDLFQIGNHGANHVPPIIDQPTIYGLKTAGSLAAVCAEAADGQKALEAAGFGPQMSGQYWYRGAAALYSPAALRLLHQAGYSIAGFSLNGDEGATVSAERAYRLISAAKDGDVIIAHMNQPKRPAGAGVARAILALKARGYQFVRLDEAAETETAPHWQAMAAEFLRSPNLAAPAENCAALLKAGAH